MTDELNSYINDAQAMMQDKSRLLALLTQALMKAGSCREALQSVWNRLTALIRLVKAWISGDYREIPWRSIALSVAAIIYFVNPIDMIPDIIPILGFFDDAPSSAWPSLPWTMISTSSSPGRAAARPARLSQAKI